MYSEYKCCGYKSFYMFNNISNLKKHDNGVVTFTRQHDADFIQRLGCKTGWGNAYIGVPVEHPFVLNHNCVPSLWDLNIPQVEEQEWTFSEKGELPEQEGTFWVFGFDTLHRWNNMENSSEEEVVRIIENYVPIVNSFCK